MVTRAPDGNVNVEVPGEDRWRLFADGTLLITQGDGTSWKFTGTELLSTSAMQTVRPMEICGAAEPDAESPSPAGTSSNSPRQKIAAAQALDGQLNSVRIEFPARA